MENTYKFGHHQHRDIIQSQVYRKRKEKVKNKALNNSSILKSDIEREIQKRN